MAPAAEWHARPAKSDGGDTQDQKTDEKNVRISRCQGGSEHPAIEQAGLAAPRLPLAAFSSVTQPTEAASLLGQLMRLPGIAAHYSSAPNAAHS